MLVAFPRAEYNSLPKHEGAILIFRKLALANLLVRQASLSDTYAITDIYCSSVENGVFTRLNLDGTRTPTPYEELSLFERYLNGGPWMSVETCAVWLAYLLRYHDEIPLVVEDNGFVLGEAEVSIGYEPAPYGNHININTLAVHPEAEEPQQIADALINYVLEMAHVMHLQQVLVSAPSEHYAPHEFRAISARRAVIVPAKEGRVVYKATALENVEPNIIKNWHMPFGRYQNARHEWQHIWPGFWNCVPELVEPETHRYRLELSGQAGIYLLKQDRYIPHRGHVYLWTQRPLSSHMISAVRDRAAREDYSELSLFVDDPTRAMVESEATAIGEPVILAARRV